MKQSEFKFWKGVFEKREVEPIKVKHELPVIMAEDNKCVMEVNNWSVGGQMRRIIVRTIFLKENGLLLMRPVIFVHKDFAWTIV
jgi:hypothetical protein